MDVISGGIVKFSLVAVDRVRDEVGALVADALGTDDISQLTINAIVRVNRKHIDRTSRQVAVDDERLFEVVHRLGDVLTEFVLQAPVQPRFLFVFLQITLERPVRRILENQRFGVRDAVHKRRNLRAPDGLVQLRLFCEQIARVCRSVPRPPANKPCPISLTE